MWALSADPPARSLPGEMSQGDRVCVSLSACRRLCEGQNFLSVNIF